MVQSTSVSLVQLSTILIESAHSKDLDLWGYFSDHRPKLFQAYILIENALNYGEFTINSGYYFLPEPDDCNEVNGSFKSLPDYLDLFCGWIRISQSSTSPAVKFSLFLSEAQVYTIRFFWKMMRVTNLLILDA